MSENQGSSGGQGTYLDNLKQELAGLATEAKNQGTSRKNILEKYFTPQKQKEYFRILPLKGKKPIQQAFFHSVQINGQNGKKQWAKLYCPSHNDPMVPKLDDNGNPVTEADGKPVMVPTYCPLCEKYKNILKKQDQSVRGKKKDELTPKEKEIWENNSKIFKEANQWKARKFYIVRGVDKGNMKDGIKFWRFPDNFKKQGVLDKLIPVLGDFIDNYQQSYHDPEKGGDLSITMTEAINPMNNKPYMTPSAISVKSTSKLHDDPIVYQELLNDPISWRDVFKMKTAPNIDGVEYLKLVAEDNGPNNPYWDDSDQSNKKWMFPNHPELEEKANQRNRDLTDSGDNYQNFEQASDLDDDDGVTISNVTKEDVGTFQNTAVDVGEGLDDAKSEAVNETKNEAVNDVNDGEDDSYSTVEEGDDDPDYDDLPF